MPGSVHKSGNRYIVRWGKRTYHHTTKRGALAQLRLLRGIEHGWKPTRKRR
jgi:hypothetical protein